MKKSWVCPEKQLLLKFLDLQLVYSKNSSETLEPSSDFNALVHAEIEVLRKSENVSGSVTQMAFEGMDIIEQSQTLTGRVSCIDVREKAFHKVIQLLRKVFYGH